MLYQVADGGTVATVLPHGVLFRGSSEEHIRKHLIETENVLDAIIGLPANIFFGTSIPPASWSSRKDGSTATTSSSSTASEHFEKAKNQNQLRPEDIAKIIDTYRNRVTEDKYSYVATMEEIRENDLQPQHPALRRHV